MSRYPTRKTIVFLAAIISMRANQGRNLTHLKNTSCLLVDQSRDSLDASPSRQPSDGRLGNALDVIPQDLAMPLGSTLAKSFPTLATAIHVACVDVERCIKGLEAPART